MVLISTFDAGANRSKLVAQATFIIEISYPDMLIQKYLAELIDIPG